MRNCVSLKRGCGNVFFCLNIRIIQNEHPLAGLFGGEHQEVWGHISSVCIYL